MARVRITMTVTHEYEFVPGEKGWDYLSEGSTVEDYLNVDIEGYDPEQGGDPLMLLDDSVIELKGEILDA